MPTATKSTGLKHWLWKWHMIAGLFCLPFMLLLALTGILYLFKDSFNDMKYFELKQVAKQGSTTMPLTAQLAAAQSYSEWPITAVQLPAAVDEDLSHTAATEFHQQSIDGTDQQLFVNPYDSSVTGTLASTDTLMYKIRKLHGELLLGLPGTLLIEMVASWFLVLIITGLYVWWPRQNKGTGGVFTIRTQNGDRNFRRDMHVVLSFWLSLFLLIVLAGGMPWTKLFGSNLQWLETKTNTGYPATWNSAEGLYSEMPKDNKSQLNIDAIAQKANKLSLKGQITIELPTTERGMYKISNRAFWLSDQQVIYVDQYSGEVIKAHRWQDAGILIDLRQFFMRLHLGEYGWINWLMLLLVTQVFIISTVSALLSYWRRKPDSSWGLPAVPTPFHIDKFVLILIVLLAIIFPMFGLSVVLILVFQMLDKLMKIKSSAKPSAK